MNRHSWTIFCLAYLVGLLSTGFFNFSETNLVWPSLILLAIGLGIVTTVLAWTIGSYSYFKLRKSFWLEVFIIAIAAAIYFQIRIPQPQVNDISNQLQTNQSQKVVVTGKILNEPRLTSDNKVKFWLNATEVETAERQHQVIGKLYVTLPLLQATGLYPSEEIKIAGVLYKPRSPQNPSDFNFKKYLQSQGIFAGLKGWKIVTEINNNKTVWGWWKIRKRIVHFQLQGLGSPVGQLVSSITLGRKAVDLPEALSSSFIQVGLAHILAASGFQVALSLGLVLKITRNLTGRWQFIVGAIVLLFYLGLTGLQPSVIRATLMGVFVLFALTTKNKIRPLGSLLLAAIIILLFNPLWIWDLGFQLSFLATLGLIVTAPILSRYLDWLPPSIATAIAIPLAASIWTLPLLIYVFKTVAVYSLIVNILSTPLITIISLGGMISGAIGLIIPWLGSWLAKIIYFPTIGLVELTQFFKNLPVSTMAVGEISLISLILLYGIICLIWQHKWWQKHWWIGLIITILLLAIPVGYRQLNLVKVTVLVAEKEPIVVIQDRGKFILINSGEAKTAKYTVLPFLASQGINHLDYAIALEPWTNFNNGWSEIARKLTIKNFISNQQEFPKFITKATKSISAIAPLVTKNFQIKLIKNQLVFFKLKHQEKTWLIINREQIKSNSTLTKLLSENELDFAQIIVLWSGKTIDSQLLKILKPQIAIATAREIEATIQQQLNHQNVQLYLTGQDGTISWQPRLGFETSSATETAKNSFF